jgi:hypothetical protein
MICGRDGALCARCQQDRADARMRALVRALLSHNKGLESTDDILGQEGLL